jgi:hypothetical protein
MTNLTTKKSTTPFSRARGAKKTVRGFSFEQGVHRGLLRVLLNFSLLSYLRSKPCLSPIRFNRLYIFLVLSGEVKIYIFASRQTRQPKSRQPPPHERGERKRSKPALNVALRAKRFLLPERGCSLATFLDVPLPN